MLLILGAAILAAALAIVLWPSLRARHLARRETHRRAIVSGDDANAPLYPYVFVSDRGSVRELHVTEKQLLETPFHRLDSGRPYVKLSYDEKNRRGSLSGYCRRSEIPRRLRIGYPPIERPAHPH